MSTPKAPIARISCLLLAGCFAAVEDEAIESSVQSLDLPTVVSGVTLTGRATFDDRRDYGRFALRATPSGATGAHHGGGANYLGLYDATVIIYELDVGYFNPSETDCRALTEVGRANVGPAGAWNVTLSSVTDTCGSDLEAGNVRLGVVTRLEHTGTTRGFAIVDPATGTENEDMEVWSLWQPTASQTAPRTVSSGQSIDLGTQRFEDASGDTRKDAAMIFASIVDVTRKFHVQNDWPFFLTEYGAVYVRYPSAENGARALGPRTIEIGGAGEYGYGWTPLHEYGHILHERVTPNASSAWGTLGRIPCGNNYAQPPNSSGYVLDTETECDSWSRDGELEYSAKAWKEGFADFAAHVTLENVTSPYPVGCSAPQYDVNDSADGVVTNDKHDRIARRRIFGCFTTPYCTVYGADYPTNVARALCDWFDGTPDDDPQRTGGGDIVSHSLYEMYLTMSGAYDTKTEQELSSYGFNMCDFAAYHVTTEGQLASPHRETLANNGFTCSL
jgi:hypothetical protein